MELILNITSYHRLSPEIEASKTVVDKLIFGRSEACDWHLPDPEKIISSKHGQIVKEGDSFYIYDNSTNGTFINFAVTPLGQGNRQVLADSDVLTIGDFQIDVKLVDDRVSPVSNTDFSASQNSDNNYRADSKDSFSQSHQFLDESILDESMPGVSMVQEPFLNSGNQIPEDWDDLSRLMNPEHSDASKHDSANVQELKTNSPRVQSESRKIAPKEQTVETASPKIAAKNSTALSDAFLKGLNIKPEVQNSLNTEKHWFEMGQGLNLLLNGLMDSLRQRAHVKSQLRLNHTMFQTEQNNPLKFSANIDDVIQNLFIRNSASFLSSKESINESFIDSRRHEHALLAGADGVLKGMLEQVSPQQISQQANDNSNVLKIIPGQIESKCWKLYQSLHDDLSQDVSSKGAMAMSDDFLKAYNDRLKETL
ncbi:type VI secretion system-associated FHA domain protein TagH [Pseudoalteromonas fuliginea]|uniref:Type VI secretion system-associated FHA domain protein TagH n=1 Tax=Pseudoalteromonas fuliginea TaxID=1872678 RepID=A0AB73BJF5_9GAMM|nr:type VI secretion system-associated FHA domain protein TagH [Pseudoalteromonas fuliginea]KAA1162589.1 type VI secretion system-associated FHA domain protein TagH [Pseudoalteromonas fuliginea]